MKVSDAAQTDFKTDRMRGLRARHMQELRRRQFARTAVHDRLDSCLSEDRNYPVKEMCFGDPSLYEGMGPYEGLHRFLRRIINFQHDPREYASYQFWGHPQFIEQIRRGSTHLDQDYVEVPAHVAVYPTSGVAGTLRMVCPAVILPPDAHERDNVVVPKLTYLSHSGEAAFAGAEVRSCALRRDGQTDLDDMFRKMDPNTQMIILATVGNPLGIAMEPSLFDEMLLRTEEKMREYGHPIVVLADVIYEHFRRDTAKRIDPIQHALRLGVEVPVIETSSFSKMLGIPGYRIGFHRDYMKKGGLFADFRDDLFLSVKTVYGPSLDPVPTVLQKTVGSLYAAINAKQPVEEKLAPVAAVLASLRELTEMEGGGDTHTMMPEEVAKEIVAHLGFEPGVWFTTSAIAKRVRKLANDDLNRYNIDIKTSVVEEVGDCLEGAGMIEVRRLEVNRERLLDIFTTAVLKHASIDDKIRHGLQAALASANVQLPVEVQSGIVMEVLLALTRTDERFDSQELQGEFGISGPGALPGRTVQMMFYRLTGNVPEVKRRDGKLMLKGISERAEWHVIAKKCNIPTEDQLYRQHKESRREASYERTSRLIEAFDMMAKMGLGVYLHPSYYDEQGNLKAERVESFYVLVGFEKLKHHPCQAAELVSVCKRLGLPLMATTPGEVFLAEEERTGDDSYVRIVTLDTLEDIDAALEDFYILASNLSGGELFPYRNGPMSDMPKRAGMPED